MTTPDPTEEKPDMSNHTVCAQCGVQRSTEKHYDPVALITGDDPGWYSGDDGEFCPQCMVALFKQANR